MNWDTSRRAECFGSLAGSDVFLRDLETWGRQS